MEKIPAHGILTEDSLQFVDSTSKQWVTVPTSIHAMKSIGSIIDTGVQYGLERIWVHLTPEGYERLPDSFITDASPDYDVTPKEFEKWAYYSGWCTRGEKGHRPSVGIGFTNHQFSDWNIPEDFTAKKVYGTFYYLETLLNTPMQWSTGNVGQGLMRRFNTGKREGYLTPCTSDMKLFHQIKGTQLNFKRRLTPEELTRKYVHHIDKNAAYLGACTVPLGIGEYEHVYNPQFVKYIPALWNVIIEGTSLYEGKELPAITPLLTGERRGWLYTPTVQLLIDMGYRVTCLEACLWPIKAKVLDTWCAFLSEGYYNIRHNTSLYPNKIVREVAKEAFKGVYVKSLSRMSHDGVYVSKNSIDRPDWYGMILSESAGRMIRNIATFASQGYFPVMAYTDGLYYVSDSPDLTSGLSGLRTEGKVGHYKHVFTIPLEACCELLQSDLPASETIGKLKQIAKECVQYA